MMQRIYAYLQMRYDYNKNRLQTIVLAADLVINLTWNKMCSGDLFPITSSLVADNMVRQAVEVVVSI